MSPGSLSKPAQVEVLQTPSARRLWEKSGLSSAGLVSFASYDGFGSYKELFLIPAAESHIAAANEHFAFFSAEEGEDNQAEEEADQ